MSALALPALAALLFKVALLAYALRTPRRGPTTRLFMILLVLFSLHNVVEFFGFNHLATHGLDQTMQVVGYLYFVVAIPFFAILLHLSLRLSTENWDTYKGYAWLLYVPVPVLEYLLLGTDKLVTGFQVFNSYTILRVPGPLYFLFETYAPLYLLAALVYLLYGARSSRPSTIDRIRNRYWLAGLVPFVLLHTYLITANHFGQAKLSASAYNPIAVTIFLLVATYATHQYRLFDIEFFLPWSKVRKRKTAFYTRIKAVIAEIAEMQSVKAILNCLANAMQCQVALIGGPRPLVALARGQQPRLNVSDPLLSQFPREVLQGVRHIVVANEIAEASPQLHVLMKQHKVGAIVPFNSHNAISAHWMLLGEHFSDNVYTPLDFKVVETLFNRIAERFLDNLTLLRSQLADVQSELQDVKRRLAIAWDEQTTLRAKLAQVEAENRALRAEKAQLLRRNLRVVEGGPPEPILSGQKTLDSYLAEYESAIVAAALRQCRGNKIKAARILGIWPNKLDYLIERLGLNPREYD